MYDSRGDLLIGGMRLRHLQCSVEDEQPTGDSTDWLLAGHLHLTPQYQQQLRLERQYLLQLEDGREGLIEIVEFTPGEEEVLAGFRPLAKKPR